jgi:hypothetical protein
MDGGCALILGRFGLGFNERDRNALFDQGERGHGPYGAGSDHDHSVILPHLPLQRVALYT